MSNKSTTQLEQLMSQSISRRGFLGLGAVSLAGILASSSLMAGCSSKATQDMHKLKFVLDWTPNTNHTGLFVAKKKGFYEKEGIDLEILPAPEDGAEALVASGGADFGISFQDTLIGMLTNNEAASLAACAAVLQHNTSGIISLAKQGITSPAKMAGHTYATWELPIELGILKYCVEQDGGNWADVKLVPSTVTDEVSALQSGQVDCIWVFEGWAGIKCKQANLETNYFGFAQINEVFDYYTPVIIGQTERMNQNKDMTQAFLRATAQGYEFAAKNPAEAAKLILEEAPESDPALIQASVEFLAPYFVDASKRFGTIDPARWERFYRWVKDQGLADTLEPKAGLYQAS